jgi:hypothetical protein
MITTTPSPVVRGDDRLDYASRIGTEAIIRGAGGNLDTWRGTLHHLQRQVYGRPR